MDFNFLGIVISDENIFLPCNPISKDLNTLYAMEIKFINRRAKILYRLKTCWPLRKTKPPSPRLLAFPQARPFRWVLSSYHVPEEYAAPDLQRMAPWRILLRFLLVDLPGQLENLDGATLSSWRTHRCEREVRPTWCQRESGGWARCVVFSEREQIGPFWPRVGSWLVVAYVAGDSYEWVKNAKPENLISFGNTSR